MHNHLFAVLASEFNFCIRTVDSDSYWISVALRCHQLRYTSLFLHH